MFDLQGSLLITKPSITTTNKSLAPIISTSISIESKIREVDLHSLANDIQTKTSKNYIVVRDST